MLDSFSDMTDHVWDYAEQFVVKLYSPSALLTPVTALPANVFHRAGHCENLPPTHDSLTVHLKPCQHQMSIWHQANGALPVLSPPEDCGGEYDGRNNLRPILMDMNPVP